LDRADGDGIKEYAATVAPWPDVIPKRCTVQQSTYKCRSRKDIRRVQLSVPYSFTNNNHGRDRGWDRHALHAPGKKRGRAPGRKEPAAATFSQGAASFSATGHEAKRTISQPTGARSFSFTAGRAHPSSSRPQTAAAGETSFWWEKTRLSRSRRRQSDR
jgi:hypothetical protein